ncbi:NFATC2-interacting protein [Rhineura floridana]|uniref:NFATC2-interacting protein n=1 Tax=Rhineura floridana TaxID=261503 RepID=UPI002AC84130|nr:NFATC2-interacting protein [Rhineura floridana]
MAETADSCSSSDSEPEGTPKKPLIKRRRLFTDMAVPMVPVYSSKVQNSLQLFPESLKLPIQIPMLSSKTQVLGTSDDDDDDVKEEAPTKQVEQETRCQVPSPSPPPPPQPRKRCYRAQNLDQKLRNLTSSLSAAKKSLQDEGLEDDVIVIDAPEPSESQDLVLKVRCRTDLYRVSIRMTDPLQRVIEHMGQMLKVHPNRILLLFQDRELAADATPCGLGLGVADIIDCIVETSSRGSDEVGNLQLRVQGKDKSSQMEITLQRGEPLQALMSRYRQAQGLGRRKLIFYFDGQRLAETWTPEELGMESGDVIEVWS